MLGLSACGGDDEASDGATVPLYTGDVPQANEAIDLRPAPSGEVHDVAMVGDSITVASTDEIEKAVQSLGVDLTIRAEVGRRIGNGETPAPGTSIVDEILADDTPDLWVIALGTNDLGQFDTDEEYQAAIESLLSLIPAGTPVAWINTYVVAKPDESAQFDVCAPVGAAAPGTGDDRQLGGARRRRGRVERRDPSHRRRGHVVRRCRRIPDRGLAAADELTSGHRITRSARRSSLSRPTGRVPTGRDQFGAIRSSK